MKFIQSFISFITEQYKEKDFEDKIKDHGYFKGISTSTARKKAAQMNTQSKLPDDDPSSYNDLPGDTKGKKLLKPSKHTKNYQRLYSDKDRLKTESVVNWELYQRMNPDIKDTFFKSTDVKYHVYEKYSVVTATGISKENNNELQKMGVDVKQSGPGWYLTFNTADKRKVLDYLQKIGAEVNENLNEKAGGDRSPIDNDEIETALKKKSEETGVPVPLLRIVMRRGMAAWKSGHRPGAGQEQWGYARTNSFLTKQPGTWGRPINDPKRAHSKDAFGADSDVAHEVIKGGYDKKLKEA